MVVVELLGPEEVDEQAALTRMILQRSIEEQSFLVTQTP
jgi:hypothetical protein